MKYSWFFLMMGLMGSQAYAQAEPAWNQAGMLADNHDSTQKNDAGAKKSVPAKNKAKTADKGKKTAKPTQEEQRAEFYTLVGKLLEAEKKEQYGSALAYCEQALEKLPDNVPDDLLRSMQMTCSVLYSKNGQYEKELALVRKLSAEYDGPDKDIKESLCLMESTALTQLNRYEEARVKLESCAKTGASAAVVSSNLAELYMTQGDVAKSVQAYRQAIEISPKNQHALYGLATALARNGQWQDALAQFLEGVKRDPGFNYLKDAFFVPEAEADFQRGFMFLALYRYREAEFYLSRYAEREMRAPYREMGQKVLSQLKDMLDGRQNRESRQFPVILENVRAMAMDASGRYLAFAVMIRPQAEEIHGQVWIFDTQTGKADKRLALNNAYLTDMAFVGESTVLRVLGSNARYELDVEAPQNGYYVYANNAAALALSLMPSGESVVAVTPENQLSLSPWLKYDMQVPMGEVPHDARRAVISSDHSEIVYTKVSQTDFVSAKDQRVMATLPMQFDIGRVAVHPQKTLFAIGIQSGVLIVDPNGTAKALIGSPELSAVSVLSFDPTGKYLSVMSNQLVEIWKLDDILDPWVPIVGRVTN